VGATGFSLGLDAPTGVSSRRTAQAT